MLLPSANVLVHSVTLTLNIWGQDQDGFRLLTGSRQVANIPCQVDPQDPEREVKTSGDGLERITTLTAHELIFLADYGLQIDDEIDWTDAGGNTHHMIVVGVNRQAGRAPVLVKANERV